jgi:hypothetical protein
MRIGEYGELRVQYLDPDGPIVSTSNDTSDLIGNAWVDNVGLIAIPVSRLDPAFFELRSGIAGEVTQKLVNYHLRLAVVGDVSEYEAGSNAFRDWVWESNRGAHVWFVPDEAALEARISSGASR